MSKKDKPTIEETEEFTELILKPIQKALDSYKLRNLSKKKGGIQLQLERDGVELTFTMKLKNIKKIKKKL